MIGELSYPIDVNKYNYQGKYCAFIQSGEQDYGYKIFYPDLRQSLSSRRKSVEDIFNIQKMLSKKGFAPKPHEIICCYDDQTFYYGIKMETIKGKFIKPSKKWVDNLLSFCEKNGLDRKDCSIEKDCVPKNIIKRGKNTYLVDIDGKHSSFWMDNKLDDWELK